ncbi:hypothetical protein QYF36_025098 [Acer negundo]|nr:hypothetical protein QYF36_025098 [Acer negundo]
MSTLLFKGKAKAASLLSPNHSHLIFMMPSSSYLILLLLVFNAYHFISADVLTTSIDCGASGSYIESSINWTGDKDLIQNGEAIVVGTSNGLPQAMTTLRVFTTRRKNCYSIAAEKGTRYLLRASFYYGNHDNKATPPVFDLQFDGNHWITVVTSMDTAIFHEAIYVAKADTISVCVAQTFPKMFPFISAVEVRSLTPNMYSQVDANYGLILRRRVAFGTKDIVKYPDDNYDRIWFPAINSGIFTEATSSAIIANTLDNDPPTEVLRNAFITQNTSTAIVLRANLPLMEVPILMNMYFSEVDVLDSTEERSFEFYINDVIVSDPIIPPYGKAIQRYLKNFSASSNTSFALGATSNSTLPPLINALEVFTITDQLTDGTSPDDGSLPDFSSLDALETIDLQNNRLNGPIPDFLGTLPKLKTLNLANNGFSGPVPSSLSKNTNLKLIVSGNPDLCTSGNSCKTTNTKTNTNTNSGSSSNASPSKKKKKKKSNKLPLILGVTAAALVIFFVALGSLAILHQQRKSAAIAAAATTGQTVYKGGNGPNGGTVGLQMLVNAGPTVVNVTKPGSLIYTSGYKLNIC